MFVTLSGLSHPRYRLRRNTLKLLL